MAAMAGTTYNVTIPHTSPMIIYTSTWYVDCPITNGAQICGDGQTVQGTHYTNVTGAQFQVYFWGPSLYVYGDADTGMTLTLKVNGGPETTLVPGGGMLASVDDISTLCSGTSDTFFCQDSSDVAPGSSAYAYNYAYITATQYVVGAKVSLSKIVAPYATHRSGASVSLKTYANNDPAIQYTTGWTNNGTYMQTGNSSLSQSMNLAFNGGAIWVWGFCGQRQGLEDSSYGTFTIDGNDNFVTDSSFDYTATTIPQDKKCLIIFRGGLYDTGNTLNYASGGYNNFELDSIDVLQVTGGTFLTTTAGFAFGTSTSTSIANFYGKNNGPSLGVLVAVPVVLISVFVAGAILVAVFLRKHRKARNGTMGGAGVNTYATGPLTPETKLGEHGTPSQTTGYLTYTPPPPANP